MAAVVVVEAVVVVVVVVVVMRHSDMHRVDWRTCFEHQLSVFGAAKQAEDPLVYITKRTISVCLSVCLSVRLSARHAEGSS